MFTQADLDAIDRAIANGTLEVEYAGPAGGTNKKRFRTLDELYSARAFISRQLAGPAVNDGRNVVSTSKGLGPAIDVVDKTYWRP